VGQYPMDKAERRQQILNHAREVFSKRGYHAAKIDDIVAAAGVARGTFYLYFEDKRSIFGEILDLVLARISARIVRVDPHHAGRAVAEQVRDNVRGVVEILLEDRATTKILLSDAVGVDPLFDRKLHSFYDGAATMLEESLRDGQALGIVAEGDARVMSYLTLGALKELLYQIVLRGWEHPAERIVEEVFGFLRDGYLRVAGAAATDPASRGVPASAPRRVEVG
jgi:AcrR family transcriptional regulator